MKIVLVGGVHPSLTEAYPTAVWDESILFQQDGALTHGGMGFANQNGFTAIFRGDGSPLNMTSTNGFMSESSKVISGDIIIEKFKGTGVGGSFLTANGEGTQTPYNVTMRWNTLKGLATFINYDYNSSFTINRRGINKTFAYQNEVSATSAGFDLPMLGSTKNYPRIYIEDNLLTSPSLLRAQGWGEAHENLIVRRNFVIGSRNCGSTAYANGHYNFDTTQYPLSETHFLSLTPGDPLYLAVRPTSPLYGSTSPQAICEPDNMVANNGFLISHRAVGCYTTPLIVTPSNLVTDRHADGVHVSWTPDATNTEFPKMNIYWEQTKNLKDFKQPKWTVDSGNSTIIPLAMFAGAPIWHMRAVNGR